MDAQHAVGVQFMVVHAMPCNSELRAIRWYMPLDLFVRAAAAADGGRCWGWRLLCVACGDCLGPPGGRFADCHIADPSPERRETFSVARHPWGAQSRLLIDWEPGNMQRQSRVNG
jgi:hypothetical protein